MAQISAALVKQLRDKTQLPMMDCKKALQQADGDIDQAEDILRKSGALAAAKKAGRETAEGRISVYGASDRPVAAIVEVRCETAPVANTDDFATMCTNIARHVAESETLPSSVDALLSEPVTFQHDKTVGDLLADVINRIRENMQIARFTRVEGDVLASYEHHNGQVAVVVQLAGDGETQGDARIGQFGRDICMHVAAVNPMALDRDGLPADLVEKEKQIIQAQVAEQAKNKPPQIVEKITQGKLNKWFNENVLLEQAFVKDDKKSVKQVLSEFGKSVGKQLTIKSYVRYEVGGTD